MSGVHDLTYEVRGVTTIFGTPPAASPARCSLKLLTNKTKSPSIADTSAADSVGISAKCARETFREARPLSHGGVVFDDSGDIVDDRVSTPCAPAVISVEGERAECSKGDSYRPKLRCMRGPGPKWLAKHQPWPRFDSEAVPSAGQHRLSPAYVRGRGAANPTDSQSGSSLRSSSSK
jgi:hypothetical protein